MTKTVLDLLDRIKIVICGSARFIDEISVLAKKLRNKEFFVTELYDVPYSQAISSSEKLANKVFYFKKIRESDLLLIYDKNGYVGLSTAMEIQYSLDDNRKRPIRFLYMPEKIEFHALCVSKYYDVVVNCEWLI